MCIMKKIYLLFVTFTLLHSCTLESEANLKNDKDFHHEYLVSETLAYEIATKLDWSKYLSNSDYKKQISGFRAFKDEETNFGNLIYIVNYSDNSFIIISGDKRLTPILAFSEEGAFPLNNNTLPGGLIDWLNEAKNNIVSVRLRNVIQSVGTSIEWKRIISDRVEPIGDGCPDGWFITKQPLLETAWGQWHGYNNLAPNKSCGSVNGNVPSGCVATAMSQIMRYHEHPTGYNYAIMPNTRNFSSPSWNSSGFDEISKLMLDTANSVQMDWDCEGSGADTEDAKNALITNFGYSNHAQYINYNSTKFKAEIDRDRPVILRGSTEKCFIGIFCWGEGGHAWVADGYKDSYSCVENDNGECMGCWGRFWLHMNWGWNDFGNGWYSDFKVENNDFTYDKKMIYRITP